MHLLRFPWVELSCCAREASPSVINEQTDVQNANQDEKTGEEEGTHTYAKSNMHIVQTEVTPNH